jgi:hypothetical protein
MQSIEPDVAHATKPRGWEDAPLPRRDGPRTLLPTTWLSRTLAVDYAAADGRASSITGTYLDWCPTGLILNAGGTKTVVSWDRIALIELRED